MKIQGVRLQGTKLVPSGAAVVDSDTYFNLVSLLLPGNGTNGQTNNTFLDSSTNALTVTRSGNPTQGTFSPFSQTGWSNYFDGTGDYITFPSASRANLGALANTQMTWEFWIYTTNIQAITAYATGIFGNLSSVSVNGRYAIGASASGVTGPQNIYFQYTTSTSTLSTITSTGTLNLNSWNHIAITVDATTPASSTVEIFINGSGETFTSQNLSTHTTTPAIDFILGEDLSGNQGLTGYISNFRVVRGSLVYTSNFTPPTAALTAITNTVVLTSQSNRFIDNSTNAYALTIAGNTSVQAFAPFNPTTAYSAATVGGSAYFDGTGDYLTAPDNATFNFGSNDFTIEMWVYPTAVGQANLTLLYAKPNGSGYSGIIIGQAVSGYDAVLYASSTGTSWNLASTASIGTMIPNAWNHIVVSRSGTNIRGFLNGTVGSTTAVSTTALVSTSSTVSIGSSNGTASTFVTGYISGLRVLNGTGYTSITVPTAPPTAIANTSLLLNYTNGGITDAAAKNIFESINETQISTAQSKFGGSSIAFDGNADYLTSPVSTLYEFGTGDFTVELWVRFNSTSGTVPMVNLGYGYNGTPLGAYNAWGVVIVNNVFYFSRYLTDGSSNDFTASWTPATNTWYHVAVSRQGTSLRAFIDGTQLGTTQTNSVNYVRVNNDPLYIGQYYAGNANRYLNGYIDDLRITKGYARYTANFTAPTQAFPTQ